MIDLTRQLVRWLARNNLPTEGVTLTLSMPTPDGAAALQCAVAAEFSRINPWAGPVVPSDHGTCNGVAYKIDTTAS